MKRKVLQILMATLISSMFLAGCGQTEPETATRTSHNSRNHDDDDDDDEDNQNLLTKDDIDIDELKENDGLMLSMRHSYCGECDTSDDYWISTTYDVYYDGTIIIYDDYNISGIVQAGGQLSDKDYKKLYLFGFNGAAGDLYADIHIDACDGDDWCFDFYNEDGDKTNIYGGYTYGIDDLEDIQNILGKYEDDLDFTSMTDGADNGYEYEYIPEAGTWEEAYYNKLIELQEDRSNQYGDNFEWGITDEDYPYGYALCDITGDGTPELIIKKGSCEADYNDDVYSFDNGELKYLGVIWAGHSAFYSVPGGGMVRYMGHMGYGEMSYYYYEDGELCSDFVMEESGYDDDGNWDDDFEYSNPADYYDGAAYINYEALTNTLYLDAYDGKLPEYNYTDEVADARSAEAFYNDIIDNNGTVYSVGDIYMKGIGVTEFNELLKEDVIYDYMTGDLHVVDRLIADVDGNGSYECVVYLSTVGSDYIEYEAILSQENGTVYCYLVFSQLGTELNDDGYLLMYGETPVKPLFYKNQITWIYGN